jgi:hypothetical protein
MFTIIVYFVFKSAMGLPVLVMMVRIVVFDHIKALMFGIIMMPFVLAVCPGSTGKKKNTCCRQCANYQ